MNESEFARPFDLQHLQGICTTFLHDRCSLYILPADSNKEGGSTTSGSTASFDDIFRRYVNNSTGMVPSTTICEHWEVLYQLTAELRDSNFNHALCVLIICKLLKKALDGGFSRTCFIKGYRFAAEAVLKELFLVAPSPSPSASSGSSLGSLSPLSQFPPSCGTHIQWSDEALIRRIIRSTFRSNSSLLYFQTRPKENNMVCYGTCGDQFGQVCDCHLTTPILEAFLSLAHSISDGPGKDSGSESQVLADEGKEQMTVIYQLTPGIAHLSIDVQRDRVVMDLPEGTLSCPSPTQLSLRNKNMMMRKESSSTANHGLIVAVFDCSLELPEHITKSYHVEVNVGVTVNKNHHRSNTTAVSTTDTDTNSSTTTTTKAAAAAAAVPSKPDCRTLEQQWLDDLVAMIERSHVTCVVCQRRVHPYLVRKLAARGVYCLHRVSIRFIGVLLRLSGARLLGQALLSMSTTAAAPPHSSSSGSNDMIEPSSLGYLAGLSLEYIHGRMFTVATGFGGREMEEDDCDMLIQHVLTAAFPVFSSPGFTEASTFALGVSQRYKPCCSLVIGASTMKRCTELEKLCRLAMDELQLYLQVPFAMYHTSASTSTSASSSSLQSANTMMTRAPPNSPSSLSLSAAAAMTTTTTTWMQRSYEIVMNARFTPVDTTPRCCAAQFVISSSSAAAAAAAAATTTTTTRICTSSGTSSSVGRRVVDAIMCYAEAIKECEQGGGTATHVEKDSWQTTSTSTGTRSSTTSTDDVLINAATLRRILRIASTAAVLLLEMG